MKLLPLNVQTLIADLVQNVQQEQLRAASVHVRTIAGRKYLYGQERSGRGFVARSLGPVGDPVAERAAASLRHAGARARERRKLVTLIRNAGVPAPTGTRAQIIEAVSAAGLFEKNLILVGTGAFQVYSALVGAVLGALQTQDADLAVRRWRSKATRLFSTFCGRPTPRSRPCRASMGGKPQRSSSPAAVLRSKC